MSKRLKLSTTITQFDALHAALDKVRATSTTVKVDREHLANLLRDHSSLMALHQGKTEETE